MRKYIHIISLAIFLCLPTTVKSGVCWLLCLFITCRNHRCDEVFQLAVLCEGRLWIPV